MSQNGIGAALPTSTAHMTLFSATVVGLGRLRSSLKKRAYPVQRAFALYGVWEMMSVTSLTLAYAIRGDCDLNPGPFNHGR